MKKWIIVILILFLFLTGFNFVSAAENSREVEIKFFYSTTCQHCLQEKIFLEELEKKYPDIKIKKFAVSEGNNIEILKQYYQEYNLPAVYYGWVPITFIGERYFVGFGEGSEAEIENYILGLEEGNNQNPEAPHEGVATPINLKEISIPFLGKVDVSRFSPLALAVILGGLDGFNACAMVALGFLLAVLVSTGTRKRVFLIGGTFIFVSGLVYFVFISAWFNLFLILGQIKFISYLVGILIVLFAVFLLKDYFQGIICKICRVPTEKENIIVKTERKLFEKIQAVSVSKVSLPLMLLGVAGIAAGVNLVELVCSFGFPLAFTRILAGLELSVFSYYLYLLVYIVFYMLDDFLVFIVAVLTLRITHISEKYLKTIKLISGFFLLVLGLIILFYPQLLFFR